MSISPASLQRSGVQQTQLAFAAFFSAAALRVCDSILPRLTLEFHLTQGTSGYVIVGFSIAYGLMQLASGPLGDRLGKPRVICIAGLCCAGSALVSATASSFGMLVFGRIVWGLTAAGIIPLAMAWIGDRVPYHHRQGILARLLAGTLSGMVAGQMIGGLLVDTILGWRGAFAILAVGYLAIGWQLRSHLKHRYALMPAAAVQLASDPQVTQLHGRTVVVLGNPWARTVLLTTGLEGVFLLGPLAYVPSYLHYRFSIALPVASAYAALYAAGGLAYAFFARYIVARLGERGMVLCGGAFIGAGLLAMGQLPYAALAGSAAFLIGFGAYLFHNTLQTHATQMAPSARGTAVSFFSFSLFVGQALGVMLAGDIVDRAGYGLTFELGAIVMPLSACAFAALLTRRSGA